MINDGRILLTQDYASDAFADNIIRLELLADGVSVYTTFNSKKEQTAQSYVSQGGVAHA
jgi:hypothetical protein